MSLRLEQTKQVEEFILHLAPEPRRLVREGLRRLAREEGDIKPLNGDFALYYRLRVGSYRIIFSYASRGSQRIIRCILAERRALVYQVFSEIVTTLRETSQARADERLRKPIRYRAPRKKTQAK